MRSPILHSAMPRQCSRLTIKQDVLCFAATHDIELTVILKECCDNIHFRETVKGNSIHFDYLLRQGPSTTRNAILLLSTLDFPSEIIEAATVQAGKFHMDSIVNEGDEQEK